MTTQKGSVVSGLALRPLAGFEAFCVHYDAVLGFNFSMAFTFQSKLPQDRWRQALKALQRRHPLLRAGIEMDGEKGPVFVDAPHRQIEIQFAPRNSGTDWQRVMEEEFTRVFHLGGPLLRANLLEDDFGCDLVLCAHHSLLDAIGMIALARDLLLALCGTELPELPLPASIDDHLARIRRQVDFPEGLAHAMEDWEAALAALPPRKVQRHTGSGVCQVSALRIEPEQTGQFLRSARKQGATLGAALLAALAIAVGRERQATGDADIRLAVPIDVRPFFGNVDDCVLAAITSRAYLPLPHPGFWPSARNLHACVSPFRSLAEIDASTKRLKALLAANLPPEVMLDVLFAQAGTDICVSNLKSADIPTCDSGLSLQSVWGPSILTGSLNGHYVGSATSNGALHLTYSSHAPMEGLLDEMQRLLVEASRL